MKAFGGCHNKSGNAVDRRFQLIRTLVVSLVLLPFGTLFDAQAQHLPIASVELLTFTNWVQRLSEPPLLMRGPLAIGEFRAPWISTNELLRYSLGAEVRTDEIPSRFRPFPYGTVVAEGYGINKRGDLFLWRYFRDGSVEFNDLIKWECVVPLKGRLSLSNAPPTLRKDLRWPSASEIAGGRVVIHPGWKEVVTVEIDVIRQKIVNSVAHNKRNILTFDQMIDFKKEHFVMPQSGAHVSFIDGALVTSKGELILWEIYLNREVFLQNSAAQILHLVAP
jgi:hypothetical protein